MKKLFITLFLTSSLFANASNVFADSAFPDASPGATATSICFASKATSAKADTAPEEIAGKCNAELMCQYWCKGAGAIYKYLCYTCS